MLSIEEARQHILSSDENNVNNSTVVLINFLSNISYSKTLLFLSFSMPNGGSVNHNCILGIPKL